jgi:hypothetical protein
MVFGASSRTSGQRNQLGGVPVERGEVLERLPGLQPGARSGARVCRRRVIGEQPSDHTAGAGQRVAQQSLAPFFFARRLGVRISFSYVGHVDPPVRVGRSPDVSSVAGSFSFSYYNVYIVVRFSNEVNHLEAALPTT